MHVKKGAEALGGGIGGRPPPPQDGERSDDSIRGVFQSVKNAKFSGGAGGGGAPPKMFEEAMIQERVH